MEHAVNAPGKCPQPGFGLFVLQLQLVNHVLQQGLALQQFHLCFHVRLRRGVVATCIVRALRLKKTGALNFEGSSYAVDRRLDQADQGSSNQTGDDKTQQGLAVTEDDLPVLPQAVVATWTAKIARKSFRMLVDLRTLLIPQINLCRTAVFSLNRKFRCSHFSPLNQVSRHSPDGQAGSGLDRRFQPAQRRFFAGAARYK